MRGGGRSAEHDGTAPRTTKDSENNEIAATGGAGAVIEAGDGVGVVEAGDGVGVVEAGDGMGAVQTTVVGEAAAAGGGVGGDDFIRCLRQGGDAPSFPLGAIVLLRSEGDSYIEIARVPLLDQ